MQIAGQSFQPKPFITKNEKKKIYNVALSNSILITWSIKQYKVFLLVEMRKMKWDYVALPKQRF